MSRRRPTATDYARIRDGFVAAGLSRDFLNGEEIERLWQDGKSTEQIVQIATKYARRSGETTEAEL